tara:strand:- start:2720 stop:3313 length:594 start_codon:yes stop_codon:yes gene_type:complete
MDDKVRIPVEVETKEARTKLRQLGNDKKRAGKRITSAARRTSRMATRAFAFTGAASVIGKFQNNEPSGNVDVFGEAMAPTWAYATQLADKKLGYSATALKSAREKTKAAFAITVGRNGEMAGATDFYNTVSKMQTDVEAGRNIIRQDPRFIGPDLETVTDAALRGNLERFLQNVGTLSPVSWIGKGFQYLVDGITAE